MKWGLFIPTYKRKSPLCLQMLDKDKELIIHLCVRHEELESGFYDHLKDNDRIHLVDLGTGLKDLGDTRARIMEYCHDNEVQYCCMFDDCIFDVNDGLSPSSTISQVFDTICYKMEIDTLAKYMVGWSFVKRSYLNLETCEIKTKRNRHIKDVNYFIDYAGQAVVLNVEMLRRCCIFYHSLEEVGFEDAYLYGQTIKAGLVWGGRKFITIDGAIPNAPKPGGSHHDNFDIEKKYDKHNIQCMELLNMMGIHLVKKYYEPVNGYISFIDWDLDYFREVLCENRDKNQKIIDTHFETNF